MSPCVLHRITEQNDNKIFSSMKNQFPMKDYFHMKNRFFPALTRCWLVLLTMLAFGISGCTSLPKITPLPKEYMVYPAATPGTLKTEDGLTLYSQWWKPADKPRAVVILLHGTAAHIGAYTPWAEYLSNQGYAMFAFDLRGWGQSQGFGRRAFVRSHDDYVNDLKLAFAEVQRVYPDSPIYLQGESLGASIALQASIQGGFPIKGLILNAPPVYVNLKVGPRMPNWMAISTNWSAGMIGRMAPNAPLFPMQKEWALSWIWNKALFDDFSRNAIKTEPNFTHSSIAAVYVTALEKAASKLRSNMDKVKEPFILLQGEKDYLVSTPGSGRVLMEKAGSMDKTRHVYKGMSHCTLHDTGRGLVWSDIVDWLDARESAKAPQFPEAAARRLADAQRLAAETPEQAVKRLEREYGDMRSWSPLQVEAAQENGGDIEAQVQPEEADSSFYEAQDAETEQ